MYGTLQVQPNIELVPCLFQGAASSRTCTSLSTDFTTLLSRCRYLFCWASAERIDRCRRTHSLRNALTSSHSFLRSGPLGAFPLLPLPFPDKRFNVASSSFLASFARAASGNVSMHGRLMLNPFIPDQTEWPELRVYDRGFPGAPSPVLGGQYASLSAFHFCLVLEEPKAFQECCQQKDLKHHKRADAGIWNWKEWLL